MFGFSEAGSSIPHITSEVCFILTITFTVELSKQFYAI